MIKSGSVPICLKNHTAQEIMIRGITPIKDRIIYSMQKFDFQFTAICEIVSNFTKLTLCRCSISMEQFLGL